MMKLSWPKTFVGAKITTQSMNFGANSFRDGFRDPMFAESSRMDRIFENLHLRVDL